jgi:hypothetical protein
MPSGHIRLQIGLIRKDQGALAIGQSDRARDDQPVQRAVIGNRGRLQPTALEENLDMALGDQNLIAGNAQTVGNQSCLVLRKARLRKAD